MNKKIVLFNIIYYAVFFVFIKMGMDDPSSSLGYGFFIVIFWAVALCLLIFLVAKKIIVIRSGIDKIGIFTATPLLTIAIIGIILSFREVAGSAWYFNNGSYRYKVLTFVYRNNLNTKRIEYYRSSDTINAEGVLTNELWIKDSTWIYLSEAGDTIKKVSYRNNKQVE